MVDEIIDIFKQVRSVKYACIEKRNPEKLFEKGKGSCFEKNYYLGKNLEEKGYSVKYMLAEFDWTDIDISQDTISERDDTKGEHLFLKVKVEDKWINIDASWDDGLKTKFPFEEDWNGKSDTVLGVEPIEVKEWNNIPETMEVEQTSFFKKLNKELERKRNH